MNCSHCGKPLEPNDRFCQVCGTPVEAVGTTARPVPLPAKIDKVGLCPHCGKAFRPDGLSAYRWCNVLNKVAMVIFAIFAFLALLVVILSAEGIAWQWALGAGIVYAGTILLRSRARAKLGLSPCPHCGKNAAGEQVMAPQPTPDEAPVAEVSDRAASAVESDRAAIRPRRAEQLALYGSPNKTCARCGVVSPMAQKSCASCGSRFGKVIPAIQNGKRVGLTTCPGCGSVYAVRKNLLLAVGLVLLGNLLNLVLSFISGALILLSIPLMLVCFLLALLVATGKLRWFPVHRCRVCGHTPFVIECIRHSRAAALERDRRLLGRKENALTRAFTACDDRLVSRFTSLNPFPLLLLLPTVLLVLCFFVMPTSLDTIEDLMEIGMTKARSICLFESLTYVATDGWEILMVLALLLLDIVALVTACIRKLRLRLLPLILGGLAMVDAAILSISLITMRDVTIASYVMHEKVEMPAEFSAGAVPFVILLSALLLLAGLFAAYMLEREKRYKILRSQMPDKA